MAFCCVMWSSIRKCSFIKFRCFIMRTFASELIIRTITGRGPPSVSRHSMYCKDVSAVYVYKYLAEVFFENFLSLLTSTQYFILHFCEFCWSLCRNIFQFIWKSNCNKVKRQIVTQDFLKGGLKMLDINNFTASLKCTWIKKGNQ